MKKYFSLGFFLSLSPLVFPALQEAADSPAALLLSTSLPMDPQHPALLACDGKQETYFLSARPPKQGDDLTITFPAPTKINGIEITTGLTTGAAEGKNQLKTGLLEISTDGETFTLVSTIHDGKVKTNIHLQDKLLAVRLRLSEDGSEPLAVREIKLAAGPGLPPIRFVTRFEVDYATAPEAKKFALKSKALSEEWYPKITELLASEKVPTPHSVLKIRFTKIDQPGVPAFTNGETITIDTEWVTQKSPYDYGMVIHELTHIVQDYKGGGDGWLTEGIADYVRFHHFEPKNFKYSLDPAKSSYKDGYRVAAAFLEWLEKTKDPKIVSELNAASRNNTYKAQLFQKYCGAGLGDLWKEFVESKK